MATLRLEGFSFDSAHHLPGYAGKCARVHGHTYRVAVEVEGAIDCTPGPDTGMVRDFGPVKAAVQTVLARIDHQDLNAVLPLHPTAELLAAWLLSHLQAAGVTAVTLYETPGAGVRVTAHDLSAEVRHAISDH